MMVLKCTRKRKGRRKRKESRQVRDLSGHRIILSGLVSSKIELEKLLKPIRSEIHQSGGLVVGEHIQRRGVSRSRKAGGSKDLEKPLNSRTYISSGKANELKELTRQLDCNLIFFINKLTESQQKNLEELTEVEIVNIE